jgi:hypothetical protein
MGTAVDLFRSGAFDPETVTVLCKAYDRARKSLRDTGQPYIVNEIIAERIIFAAKRGERDAQKLCESALRGLSSKTP